MAIKFRNIDHLKRDRQLEGEIGIDLKVDSNTFLRVLCASDANPRWTDKFDKALAEIRRLTNNGAPPEERSRRYARLFADAIVIGWHGGLDAEGNEKPCPVVDDATGELVPFSTPNCYDYLCQADDVNESILEFVVEKKNFRRAKAADAAETIKND